MPSADKKPSVALLQCEAHGDLALNNCTNIPIDKIEETAQAHREALGCYYVIHVIAKVMSTNEEKTQK